MPGQRPTRTRVHAAMLHLLCWLLGVPAAYAVIDGTELTPAEYQSQTPWLVAIEDGFGVKCTGMMIAPNWVLTAAHCLPATQVRVGNPNHELARRFAVKRNLPNPAYNEFHPEQGNDSALLELDGSYDGPLPVLSASLTLDRAVVAGWGLIEGRQSTLVARVGTVRADPSASDSHLIIAWPDPSMPCSGDSGGPLFVQPMVGSAVLFGITSFGDPQCAEFGAFTSISSVRSWILSVVDPRPPIPTGNPIPAQLAHYFLDFEYTIPADAFATTDQPLSYTCTGLPDGLEFNPASKLISGTPYQAGTFPIHVIAANSESPPVKGTNSFILTVHPARLTVTAANVSRPRGQANPPLVGTINATLGDTFELSPAQTTLLLQIENIVISYTCAATSDSSAGNYPIVPHLDDPASRLANYQYAVNNGILTVLPSEPAGYTVSGRVTNTASGAGISQLRVRLVHYHETNRVFLQTLTDATGAYRFTNIPPSIQIGLFPEDRNYTFLPSVVVRRPFASELTTNFGATLKSSPTPLVAISSLEVIQSIQDQVNSVPLVAGKDTLVRVHIRNQPATDLESRNPFTGRMRGFRDGIELTDSPLRALAPGRITSGGDAFERRKSFEQGTLNFHLPDAWCQSGTTELRLEPDAATPAVCAEPGENPGGTPNDCIVRANFQSVPVLPLRLYRISTDGNFATLADIDAALARLKAIYPISQLDVEVRDLFVRPGRDTLSTLGNANAALLQQQSSDNCSGTECRRIFYGALPNSRQPLQFGVMGATIWPSVNVGSGYLVVMEHEIGHTLDLDHTKREDDVQGPFGFCGELPHTGTPLYPTPVRLERGLVPALGPMDSLHPELAVFGLDTSSASVGQANAPRVIAPTVEFDMMSYCNELGAGWASAFSYGSLRTTLATRYFGGQFAPTAAAPVPTNVLLISGRIFPSSQRIEFEPLLPMMGIVSVARGDYTVTLLDNSGAVLSVTPFQPLTTLVEGDLNTNNVLAVHVLVPDIAGTAEILVASNQTVFGSLRRSAHAPSVTLLKPSGTDTSPEGYLDIEWEALDAENEPVTFTVQYSADAGRSFITLATGATNRALRVEHSALPAASNAIVRIVASDGFNTAEDISPPFAVPNNPPQLFIRRPAADAQFSGDAMLFFEATSYDTEDSSAISDVRWTSSRDGALGAGLKLTRSATALSEGTHRITATVTDSAGASRSASVNVQITRFGPLHLEALGADASGMFGVRLGGDAGTPFVLQTSSDLQSWVGVETNTLTSAPQEFRQPSSPERRFYRALVTP